MKSKEKADFMVVIFLIILLILSSSCGITKSKKKKDTLTETQTETFEAGTVTSKRAGDTLTITVPSVVYKDTTIFKRGKTTTLISNYDSQGRLNLQCISDEIDELKNYIKNISEDKKETIEEESKDKTTQWKPIMIVYAFFGIAFLMFIAKLIKKHM